VALSAGAHRVVLRGGPLWTAARIDLVRPGVSAGSAGPTSDVRHWGRTDRSVTVGARRAGTLLVVNENVNAGWRATIDGHVLPSVTVDGWRQGWLLPAGPAATVRLSFAPQDTYVAARVVGAITGLAVLLMCALLRRRPGPRAPMPLRLPPVAALAAVVGLGALLAGAAGAIAAAATVAVLLLARWGWVGGVLAAGAYLVAGLLLSVHHWGLAGYAGHDGLVQLLAVIAVSAAAAGRTRPARRRDREPTR
jgi:arabinofuranan 3-O-arabinosyltransferase